MIKEAKLEQLTNKKYNGIRLSTVSSKCRKSSRNLNKIWTGSSRDNLARKKNLTLSIRLKFFFLRSSPGAALVAGLIERD